MENDKKKNFHKGWASLLIFAFTVLPLNSAQAALTLLSDEPVSSLSSVRANLMFTLDNSGSMGNEYLGDYAGEQTFCKDDNDSGTGLEYCGFSDPPYNASTSNHIFYDPDIYYQPGVNADGTSMQIQNRANTAGWTQVKVNPYTSTSITDLTNLADSLWCSTTSPSSSDRSNPAICRKNGVAYSATGSAAAVSAGYNYPNSTDASGTKFEYRVWVGSAPYYYNLTSVQYCSNGISSGVNQGFGRSTSCVSKWFSGSRVKYGTFSDTASFATAFTRVNIVSTTTSYPKSSSRTDCAGTTCTYNEEMTNFANWYAYYRSRMQAMKSAAGIAFSRLDGSKFRVGFHTINSPSSFFLPVKDFDNTTNKADWYAEFYSATPSGGTPSRGATQRVGEYFRTGILPGLSAARSGSDPITASCQLNFHFLSTDGYWNESFTSSPTIGNADNIVPTLPASISSLTPGQPWPAPYRQSTSSLSGGEINTDTLSDVATYYWATDLRPSMDNRVTPSANNPATWQHMVNYGITLGAEGVLPYQLGTPLSPFTWPNPVNNSPSAIDDLWHGTINSRGLFFAAITGAELAEQISQALDSISQVIGTAARAAIDNADLTTGSGNIYSVGFSEGWVGKLEKSALDTVTGLKSGAPLWNAGDRLNTLFAGTAWDTDRRIATRNTSTNAAVPFRFANLSSTQQTALGSAAVLNYLRGDKSNEGNVPGKYRVRSGLLGDIVGSEAVPVGQPDEDYLDTDYAAFKATSRSSMVYVAANDGMVHAFDNATGDEKWAYIPGLLFKTGSAGLDRLTYRVGGVPSFSHRYYVDGTPRAKDVDFNNTNGANGSGDWRTILVGGLSKGGYGYYALDITSSATPASEAAVASKALWEFTDSDMGYSFGKPLIVKTRAHGWVVIVSSGYNNPSGGGFLYVLDAKTGTLLKKLSTGVGTASSPSGLGQINGNLISFTDYIIEQVYGGDLLGNLWRFDLSDLDPTNWRVELFAKFENPSGTPQPITIMPRIKIDPNNGITRWILVGTGRLLDDTDYSNTQVQSLYGLRDGTKTAPDPISSPVTRSALGLITGVDVGTATDKGWYRDVASREQVSKDIVADLGVAVFTTSLPPGTDPCERNPSNLYVLGYANGKAYLIDSARNPFVRVAVGVAGSNIIKINSTSGTGVKLQYYDVTGNTTNIDLPLPPDSKDNRVNWREISPD